MKKSLLCLITLTLIFLGNETCFGQTTLKKETVTDLSKTPNYVFGVKDEDGFKSALSVLTIDELSVDVSSPPHPDKINTKSTIGKK